jgi:DNA-binding LacI/PurR family transcriptional regulator
MDIREIARHATVSTSTVSQTNNRVPTVNPALANRPGFRNVSAKVL